jgi:uncharacterized protein YsxB (DUF464 family)
MVEIKIIKDGQDNIVEFSASGHTSYAPEGEDIICAAVSAILQTAVFGLSEHLGLSPEVSTEDGWLSCKLDPKLARDQEVKAILETMLIGLKKTQQSYSQYIKIKEREG